ncbi:Transposase [compost metagenome]
MPNHSLRSDFNAESLRGEATRLPALQRRYALAVARLYDGEDIEAVAKSSNVQPHTVRRWMHVFNEDGIAGFANAVMGGTYDLRSDFDAQSVRALATRAYAPAVKARLFAIAQMYEGVPTREIARLAGVSEGRLSEWRQNFNTSKIVAQGEVENRQLQANAKVRSNYWTADKVAASIQAAWNDEHRRKLEVVKLSLEGKSVDAIVKQTGSTRADVVTWIRVFEAGGPKALLPSDAARKPARATRTKAAEGAVSEVTQGDINSRRNPTVSKPGPAPMDLEAVKPLPVEGKKAIPSGEPTSDRSLTEATDKVVEFFATLARETAAPANATNAVSKTSGSVPASQAADKAQKNRSGRVVKPVEATEEVVKRGRGRPRKDGQPNKSTALLMKLAAGIKKTVKRIANDTGRPAVGKTANVTRGRMEIPFTTWHINHFLKEALGDEHARRLRCMLLLKEGGSIAEAAKKFGTRSTEIAEWRDAFVKKGPGALLSEEALEPYRVALTVMQYRALKEIRSDTRDDRSRAAAALLMLNDKHYPPFVAESVGASVKDLRGWVGNVETLAGPRSVKDIWKQKLSSARPEDHASTPPRRMSEFQHSVMRIVREACDGGYDEPDVTKVARKYGVSPQRLSQWLQTLDQHGVEGLLAETAAVQVRMPDTSSSEELRKLASTLPHTTATELLALAYLYDGASIAMAARITKMSKEDLTELVLDFNMLGLEALGFTDEQPRVLAGRM